MSDAQRVSRLGRGLGALLSDHSMGRSEGPAEAPTPRTQDQREAPIELLRGNPNQPRRHFDEAEIESLADSIREQGVLQPILVRPISGENGFEIVAGERRWRAAQKAGLTSVPIVIRDLDDRQVLEAAIVENVQRADLNPVEEAMGYRSLVDRFGHSHGAVAKAVGKSRAHVANMIRLLNLPDSVIERLREGALTAGHARPLIGLQNAEDLAAQIVSKGLSVRQSEELAAGRAASPGGKSGAGGAELKDADTAALENDLAEQLGLNVSLRRTGPESGEIKISFRTLEQLDDLCRRLSGKV